MDIFLQIPEYEFYEPKIGREWGYIENEALFDNEIDYDKTIYFKRSLPPPSGYEGFKYIPLCYYYAKNLKAKSKEGNPIFVAHYILVPSNFSNPIQNYVDLPVFNPIANMTIYITVERNFKALQKVGPIIEELLKKDPNIKSTPQLVDPMELPNPLLNKNGTLKTDKNTNTSNQTSATGSNNLSLIAAQQKLALVKKQEEEKKIKDLALKKILKEKKELMERKKKEFLANMDLSLAFPPHISHLDTVQDNSTNNTISGNSSATTSGSINSNPSISAQSNSTANASQPEKKKVPPKPKLMVVNSPAEERSLGNGGYEVMPGMPVPANYFVNDSMIMTNMRASSYYPPFNLEYPRVPIDGEVDIDNIGYGLVAKYIPPKPLIAEMKYTFFFLAPAQFSYPGNKRVYIPVYILIPEKENGRPSDMRSMLFDHFISETDNYPVAQIIQDKDSGIAHTIIATQPEQISQDCYAVVKSKFHLDSPMKTMNADNFLNKTAFKEFLKNNSLLNGPDPYFANQKIDKKLPEQVKEFVGGLLNYKSAERDKMVQAAIARAEKEEAERRDAEREKQLRDKRVIEDDKMKKQMQEEDELKKKAEVLNEQLKMMRDLLAKVNPNSTLLKNASDLLNISSNNSTANNNTNKGNQTNTSAKLLQV
jgi:hypothetical protein